jgi:hypothetical protein
MKRLALSLCVLAAGCGGTGLGTPTSPSGAAPAPATTSVSSAVTHGASSPFRGSFTIATVGTLDCPPTCPPTTLSVTATEEGTATHLGRFTAVSADVVNLATSAATGTFTFTSADGDELRATTVSQGEPLVPPNVSTVNGTGTIVGGTGRFAGATGTFAYRFTGTIDFANGTSSGSGTFDGSLDHP